MTKKSQGPGNFFKVRGQGTQNTFRLKLLSKVPINRKNISYITQTILEVGENFSIP